MGETVDRRGGGHTVSIPLMRDKNEKCPGYLAKRL